MNETVLSHASYKAIETEVKLKDGRSSGYGLGLEVASVRGHRLLEHSGEVGGFVAENMVFPDDRIAVAVLTNEEASSAASAIAKAVVPLVLALPTKVPDNAANGPEAQAKQMLAGLQAGRLDRGLLTPDLNFYFSAQAIDDFKDSLGPLGAMTELKQSHTEKRGGMVFRVFKVTFSDAKRTTLSLTTYTMPDGKLEQFLIGP